MERGPGIDLKAGGRVALVVVLNLLATALPGRAVEDVAVRLPPDVRAVWDLGKAHRESTITRERISLNGLWQWQPAGKGPAPVPAGNWGWFKVPGCWPGITDYMQKDCQTVFAHPSWKELDTGSISAAWYQREISVPDDWAGRRIAVSAEHLNSFAAVYLDGQRLGEIQFPGGELEITAACRPGSTQLLSMLVIAMPLQGVMLSHTDSASAREVKGSVARRGLCGDVVLVGTPNGPRVGSVKVATSVRQRAITFEADLDGLAADEGYALRARVSKDGVTVEKFAGPAFRGGKIKQGRAAFTANWLPDRLWDIHRPRNTFSLELTLVDAAGVILDAGWPERFGFREFWIDGRDFCLNGKRLSLSVVPLDNAQVSAGLATYDSARESMQRLRSFGINCVYTHNYGCEPGSHLGFAEILRAADDVGMLVGFSQPHFSHYDWQGADADVTNGYARHSGFYVRAAGNHPSVVMYSMSHNATGYSEDMNPDLIDGLHDARDSWALRNVKKALRAEAIVKGLDPGRIVYHHASGNLGSMHQVNFYPNFVPVQELSDWFEHWSEAGVKPAFLCEYGAPFTWDWTMYRGWYKGRREFGSAAVPWEFCLAEWNAQFLGDPAFRISEAEKKNLRWEAKQFRAGKVWHRWDYPNQVGSSRFEERYPVFAMYLSDNWRAFRSWGLSAISPWEHGHFWRLREGVDKRRRDLPVDWDKLQRPGFSPDYVDQRYERMDLAYERDDWIATPAAEALIRNNRPLLAYIAGKPGTFTSKDHNFGPGETVEKQIVVINNSREPIDCECEWELGLPGPVKGGERVTVPAGGQQRIPLSFRLPAELPPGRYLLRASFKFGGGEPQTDRFPITTLPPPAPMRLAARIALFDPKGETAAALTAAGIQAQQIEAGSDLSEFDLLVVGKAALSVGGPAPDIRRVRDGLKVVVFEQTSEVLESRFGFRVAEYGLRRVFPRIADHPILAGLTPGHLQDWRGAATILPPRLKYVLNPQFNGAPGVTWCGLPVTRLWRCGNRGNVASVLIEKPARGDFLPILDGGFSLQYSPLMEFREGKGMVLFCQLDVTGRTETDPAAQALLRNLLGYVEDWKPGPRRTVAYVGDPAGRRHLEESGVTVSAFDGGDLSTSQVLVAGPGVGRVLAGRSAPVAEWLKRSGNLLAIGIDQQDAEVLLPFKVTMNREEHISAYFEAEDGNSPFAGVGPADLHNRDPRELPLVSTGARIIADGVLARAENANVVFCQFAPWQFEGSGQSNLKRTCRRMSFAVSRLLANMGVAGSTPLLERFQRGVDAADPEQRWLDGFYLDQPEEWDDPYRFFRW